MSGKDSMSVLDMQIAILKAGWQFQEHAFLDGTACIEFTQDKGNLVFNEYPRPADCLGWGRFQRQHAWQMAYDKLIHGIDSKPPIW